MTVQVMLVQEESEKKLIKHSVIARSEATKQSYDLWLSVIYNLFQLLSNILSVNLTFKLFLINLLRAKSKSVN